MRRARSSEMRAFDCLTRAIASRVSGASSRRASSAGSAGISGRLSKPSSLALPPGQPPPSAPASRARAALRSAAARVSAIWVATSATRALVSSTGDTLPALTRLATSSVERSAIAADSSLTASVRWADRSP